MIRYLTVEQVAALHAQHIAPGLLADPGLLASGVSRPQATVGGDDAYPSLETKAAALFHSLTTTQPFVDGNKRAAVLAVIAFLNYNGYELVMDELDVVHLAEDTAEGRYDVSKIADALAAHLAPINLSDVPLD